MVAYDIDLEKLKPGTADQLQHLLKREINGACQFVTTMSLLQFSVPVKHKDEAMAFLQRVKINELPLRFRLHPPETFETHK